MQKGETKHPTQHATHILSLKLTKIIHDNPQIHKIKSTSTLRSTNQTSQHRIFFFFFGNQSRIGPVQVH